MVSTVPSLISVLADHVHAVGHLLARGKQGFEAYDDYDISLGIFPTADAAVEALLVAARIRSKR